MSWLVLCLFFSVVVAQRWPTSIPIAVRAPHFNSYIPLGAHQIPTNDQTHTNWPIHWKDERVRCVGTVGVKRLDGNYSAKLFGGVNVEEIPAATLKEFALTPTRSILTVEVGPVEATVTFLNPIEPNDLVLQSFPFMYMYCNVSVTDGREHSVRLYTDVCVEWLSSADAAQQLTWNFTKAESMLYHTVWLSNPSPMSYDESAMAEDSFLWFASSNTNNNTTYKSGAWPICRKRFTDYGYLDNALDTDYRAVDEGGGWPVYAFAQDLGNISSTSDTAVWALGLTRDPLVPFKTSKRKPHYTTKYTNVAQAMSEFLSGFEDTKNRAIALDNSLINAARNVSNEYADLVSIGARLTLGALDFTTAQDEHENDTMAFMAVSDDSRVNAVHTIFASFPALLRLNTTWAGYLLRPLDIGNTTWPELEYAGLDLGTLYPTISIQKPSSQYSIESTGDMLILVWAQARVSGDATYLSNYVRTFPSGRRAHGNNTPSNSITFSRNGQTTFDLDGNGIRNANLALKGVLGVKCMSLIAGAVGLQNDQKQYSDSADSMYNSWKQQAFQGGHILSAYSSPSSWGLIYSLFYDKMLHLDVVNEEVYNAQDAFYESQIVDNNVATFGVAFDSTVGTDVSAPWNMITAGATNNTKVRDRLITQVRAKMYANGTSGASVFPAMYGSNSTVSDDKHSAR
ncbi:hypothetical protein CYLTODRAFT_396361 [Cylindrobasidium torrendii FP15055 ss-10]|uniref:DUF1793-domain-containing protein n=1 Tax=Cylindrobasidium torrendii FP15055 ss-10 TaxID=1314674 RepID=A0A0D7BC39_9AGAR|nr:hypothetical protein CYLTODRAFT_396361 [Cylindrobasidium torrendii FP15055 ss-10]